MGDEAKDTEAAGAADAGNDAEEQLEAGQDAGALEKPPAEEPGEKPPEDLDGSDGSDESDGSAEDGEIKDGEVEGLSAAAQAKVNKRIHDLNVKRKNAEARAAEVEARTKDLDKKIQDEFVLAAMRTGLDPEYVSAEEAKLLARFENLRSWKRWCKSHRNGYEGSGNNDPSMTEDQVAEREAAIEDELLDVAGPARTLWVERTKQMRADMAAGRKLRLEKQRKPADRVDPKPPKLPGAGAGGAARRPPVGAGGRKERAGIDQVEFEKAGATEDALVKQYEKIFGGG